MTKPVPRIRKQKARRRAQDAASNEGLSEADSNALEIIPASAADREKRKRQLKNELQAQRKAETKMSQKKKKRLDKYIDTKLKKEESLELIKKLSGQQIDTSLFKSSKKLGRGGESKRERLGRVLREKRAGIGAKEEQDTLWEHNKESHDDLSSSESEDDTTSKTPLETATEYPAKADEKASSSQFGAGLKRPLEVDESGRPIIKKRKRSKNQRVNWAFKSLGEQKDAESSSEWEGFESGSEEERNPHNSDSEEVLSASMSDKVDEDSEDGPDFSDSDEESEDAVTPETSESEETEDDTEAGKEKVQERSSAFKAWASQQRNEALGFTPTTNIDSADHSKATTVLAGVAAKVSKPVNVESTPKATGTGFPINISMSNTDGVPSNARQVFNIPVKRNSEIEESRISLPVVAEEQKIMEAIHNHNTIILWGATGSGKTTQVPQFLYEAGYGSPDGPTPGLIGVTQPRRVAAVSMAKRVAVEMGSHGEKVSHQIRFDSTVGRSTAVKFMTDGILLREIAQDFTLSKYSAIIIDEAHERSINTDILIGMLSRIIDTRAGLATKSAKYRPLKLVIMSATLRTADLTQNKGLFRNAEPPIVEAEGRAHPVTIHFARRTERDYLEETFKKISRGHKKLPQGAFLVFLTGQNEISNLSRKLKEVFESTEDSGYTDWHVRTSAKEVSIEDEDIEVQQSGPDQNGHDSDSDAEIFGADNDEENEFDVGDDPEELLRVHVLPLYSQLPAEQQMRVFESAPAGSRMIVLATNVAETSLTIPDVRYVFDCGRAKEKRYNERTGIQSFDIDWISKASASQRAGRAGRTGPGHCYRLYSSAVFERDFPEFAEPEILRAPIEGVVLQLKTIGIPNVANFPFPTAPERSNLVKAERLLEYLGAISNGAVTKLGAEIALYPLSPRLSRILCAAQDNGLLGQAIALVAALAASEVFIPENQLDLEDLDLAADEDWTNADEQEALKREARRKDHSSFHRNLSRLDRQSDALKLYTALNDFIQTSFSDRPSRSLFHKYTRVKALEEAAQLNRQITNIVKAHVPESIPAKPNAPISEPTKKQAATLNQLVAAGFIDQIAIRADLSPTPPPTSRKPKRAIDVPYTTLFPSWNATQTPQPAPGADEDNDARTAAAKADAELRRRSVYIHPSSVLARAAPSALPPYLVYSHLSRAAPKTATAAAPAVSKTRMHPLTPVDAPQLLALAAGTPLLEDGKPVGRIEMLPRDAAGRERRRVACVPFLRPGSDAGAGLGWPLPPARRVVQRRERGAGWVVESVEG